MNIEFFPVMRHRYLAEGACFVCTEGRGTCWPAEKTPVSVCGDQRHALHKSCAILSLSAKHNSAARVCDMCRQKLNLATWNSTPASKRIILQLGQQPAVPSLSDRINRWFTGHPILALVSLLGLGALFGAAYSVIYVGFSFAGGWSFWLNRGKKETPGKTHFDEVQRKARCEREGDIWRVTKGGEPSYCELKAWKIEKELDRREREACEQSGDQWITLDYAGAGTCERQHKTAEKTSKTHNKKQSEKAKPAKMTAAEITELSSKCRDFEGGIWVSSGYTGYCKTRKVNCEESSGKWIPLDDHFSTLGHCLFKRGDKLNLVERRKTCEGSGGEWIQTEKEEQCNYRPHREPEGEIDRREREACEQGL